MTTFIAKKKKIQEFGAGLLQPKTHEGSEILPLNMDDKDNRLFRNKDLSPLPTHPKPVLQKPASPFADTIYDAHDRNLGELYLAHTSKWLN